VETHQILTSVVVPSVPVMAVERFAELIGLDIGVVRGWIDKGYLPTLKIGRYRLVNVAALSREALQEIES